jgi:hypothetical protein
MDSTIATATLTTTAVDVDTTLSDHLFRLLDDSAYDWLYTYIFDNCIEEAVDSNTLNTAQKIALRFKSRLHLQMFLGFISGEADIEYEGPYQS